MSPVSGSGTRVIGGGRPDYDSLLNPKTPEAIARVKNLVDRYKLEPALMKLVDDTYGPLEWRLPETHAIYWATRGLREGRGAGVGRRRGRRRAPDDEQPVGCLQ